MELEWSEVQGKFRDRVRVFLARELPDSWEHGATPGRSPSSCCRTSAHQRRSTQHCGERVRAARTQRGGRPT